MHTSSNLEHLENPAIPLRPHHGMCLAYFIGKGYSEGFSAHMEKCLQQFLKDGKVKLVVHTDEICSACPNQKEQVCIAQDHVSKYDKKVLEICGFSEGMELNFLQFASIVQQKILGKDLRESICGGCQWNEICSSHKSRWE